MTYSIFFHHGYAVHGTDQLARLGHAVSHRCVQLAPQNAVLLFGLTKRVGVGNIR